MGVLTNGKWQQDQADALANNGEYQRVDTVIRERITQNGKYEPLAGRYHLYVSHACPWAHRTLIFRELKQLTDIISVSYVGANMLANGWEFDQTAGSNGDALFDSKFLHEIYTRHASGYSGRVTVPVLWDKQTNSIVNNESAEIIRMFNSEFNDLTANNDDYYPAELRAEIDRINELVYANINNGVYRAGFAKTQQAYERAYGGLFDALDYIESLLSQRKFLAGERLTEADWRLFTTLVRFDAVYFGHFKCNKQRIADYHHLRNYLKQLYQMDGIAQTVDIDLIKQHYYYSHTTINPTQLVPLGPDLDLSSSHDR